MVSKDYLKGKQAYSLELHESLDTDDLIIPLIFLCYIYRSDMWKDSLMFKELDDKMIFGEYFYKLWELLGKHPLCWGEGCRIWVCCTDGEP